VHTCRVPKNLDLGGNDAGPEGAAALAAALTSHPSLVMLELGYNPLGPKGAESISGVRLEWLGGSAWVGSR
jgi:hypothetical protein